jgi:hypothetical protein
MMRNFSLVVDMTLIVPTLSVAVVTVLLRAVVYG